MKVEIIEGPNKSFARLGFKCPGCQDMHTLPVTGWLPPGYNTHFVAESAQWTFNGDLDRPTFTPSILVRSGHYTSQHKDGEGCWCDFEQRFGKPVQYKCYICHSFVTDGRIQFLPDCTHKLAGQTVDLPDILEDQDG